jgi:hypothetical protein
MIGLSHISEERRVGEFPHNIVQWSSPSQVALLQLYGAKQEGELGDDQLFAPVETAVLREVTNEEYKRTDEIRRKKIPLIDRDRDRVTDCGRNGEYEFLYCDTVVIQCLRK